MPLVNLYFCLWVYKYLINAKRACDLTLQLHWIVKLSGKPKAPLCFHVDWSAVHMGEVSLQDFLSELFLSESPETFLSERL